MPGPTVVLLHGVGLDHTVWEPVTALLADRFVVTTPDLPGHGARPPAPADVTLADLADGVATAIPPGSHLVGFSLGALVAQHLAVHRPDLVASLTSVASVCRRTPEERAKVLHRLDTAATDIAASSAASLERWYGGTDVGADQIARTAATLQANDPDSFLNCYRVFATADEEIWPQLGRIEVPALAVTGSDDPGSTPAMTRRLAAAIPDCRAVVIPGARHMLPVQCPHELADVITAFLDTVTGGHVHV
ncbi:alpha/beta fold hydrolase [Mycolicibacterium goodii]|uniref:alpha/beta fold hydrolase n=1 Tax=Mycolicibacterium goodii TaxID=134601 RepID=UPI000C26BF2E|nr:alpha/beta hydrolase [Mycolicibacterium goodii]MBU8807855.1 alpha/beta hydrolase [Mycolicibacterium goodii]MBU8828024.1 alpha/beta hydrolase [Mycolicibacterium goodii]PJK23651.1 alpha/beta hydrolase [Mycolicibacterium goodii]ULN47321.1 alpha/beta hydrolase [Mycolicibacterium goodii]